MTAALSLEERAIAEAAGVLASAGFAPAGDGTWTGTIDPQLEHPVSLRLPGDFPFGLPQIRVNRRKLPRRIPHVEPDGKLCLAPQSGIYLVTGRPGDLVLDAIDRARQIIRDGLSGANDGHFQQEFLAYWNARARIATYSICSPNAASREVLCAEISVPRGVEPWRAMVFADSQEQLRRWLGRLGGVQVRAHRALLLHLELPFDPPDFDADIRVEEVIATLDGCLPAKDRQFLARWWGQKLSLPLFVIVSMPLPPSQDHAVFGVRIPRSADHNHGFRRGQVPLQVGLARARRESIEEVTVHRLDAAYVLKRGGAQVSMLDKRVVLIGCGAVGGTTAMHLAAAGVGSLHLVDDDHLSEDNVHRHELGVSSVSAAKVTEIQRALGARFPHVEVTIDASKVQEALEKGAAGITSADLVVIALGDPTLEEWLNGALHGAVRRLHVWLEPLGLGGHALLTGRGKAPGCFRCLMDHGEDPGNKARFARGDKDFGVSFAGCAGTFTPYGELDADRAAIEATRLAVAALADREPVGVLVSWMEDRTGFESQGYELSDRGRMFEIGSRRRETTFVDLACTVCSS